MQNPKIFGALRAPLIFKQLLPLISVQNRFFFWRAPRVILSFTLDIITKRVFLGAVRWGAASAASGQKECGQMVCGQCGQPHEKNSEISAASAVSAASPHEEISAASAASGQPP